MSGSSIFARQIYNFATLNFPTNTAIIVVDEKQIVIGFNRVAGILWKISEERMALEILTNIENNPLTELMPKNAHTKHHDYFSNLKAVSISELGNMEELLQPMGRKAVPIDAWDGSTPEYPLIIAKIENEDGAIAGLALIKDAITKDSAQFVGNIQNFLFSIGDPKTLEKAAENTEKWTKSARKLIASLAALGLMFAGMGSGLFYTWDQWREKRIEKLEQTLEDNSVAIPEGKPKPLPLP